MQRALAHIFVYYYYYKQGLGAEKDNTSERKTWQVYCFGKRHVLRFDLKETRQGFCRREGKVVPCGGAEDRKGLGINSGKSIMRNPETETESMRRAESTGGSVNLNTVTEIRRSSGRDTFTAKSTVFPLYRILCGVGSLKVDK